MTSLARPPRAGLTPGVESRPPHALGAPSALPSRPLWSSPPRPAPRRGSTPPHWCLATRRLRSRSWRRLLARSFAPRAWSILLVRFGTCAARCRAWPSCRLCWLLACLHGIHDPSWSSALASAWDWRSSPWLGLAGRTERSALGPPGRRLRATWSPLPLVAVAWPLRCCCTWSPLPRTPRLLLASTCSGRVAFAQFALFRTAAGALSRACLLLKRIPTRPS